MTTLDLNGAWKVLDMPKSCAGTAGLAKVSKRKGGWLKAMVPGEIHLDLIRAKRMEEPLVSLNAKKSRWPEHRSWWYSTTFEVPPSFLEHERQHLVFDGLDLYAQVFLNGQYLGETKNAFIPHTFEVRHRLKRKNRLVVRLTSGEELAPEALCLKGAERRKRQSFQGIQYLRKPQFTYGWDWVDVLPNIGIWRGVRVEGHSGLVVHDVRATTRIEPTATFLDISAVVENLHPWADRIGDVVLTIEPPKGTPLRRKVAVRAQIGRSQLDWAIPIADPQLWWPNGMGEQPLYKVSIETHYEGAASDRRELGVGLRVVDIDRSPLPRGGSRFCIRINGQEVFCRGGNWIPADAIIARVDKKKYEYLVSEALNANLNMLRVWGGGIYEAPEFYEACDRAGILVWQDFMFACSEYPDQDAAFRNAVREEAEAVVRSLRHHPCIALWCGNNENVWGFTNWWNEDKDIDDPDLNVGGTRLYNQVLPDVCHALDPSRPYWPGSPYGGITPNSEDDGDCHWWWQGTMNPDIDRRTSHEVYDECTSRFVSEYGIVGPCHLDSINEYLRPEERHPESRAWQEHTNAFEAKTTPAGIKRHYADIDSIELPQKILYGQLFQAMMYGRSIEALRFRKHDPRDDCQGALIWMFNDCWGETGWTPIDYYLRRKASYYWIRNACTPVRAIVRRRGNMLVTRVVNDSLTPQKLSVRFGWIRVDGTDSQMRSKAVSIPSNSMVELARDAIPRASTLDPRTWIYAAYLVGDDVEPVPSIWTLVPHRELRLAEPRINVTVRGRSLRVSADIYCHAVHCDDRGRRIFSDNYFDLLPGVPRNIESLGTRLPSKLRFEAVMPHHE